MSWDMFSKFPPPLVRCLARRRLSGSHVVALSDEEIALGSDLPLSRVKEISTNLDWKRVSISDAEKFCKACNFDIFDSADRNRASAYLRKGAKFLYLRASPYWSETFLPLIKMMQSAGING